MGETQGSPWVPNNAKKQMSVWFDKLKSNTNALTDAKEQHQQWNASFSLRSPSREPNKCLLFSCQKKKKERNS
ncbi:hypothetical protein CDAR_26731 [Caerostris darwini]|uniref:Uncharacterized protein n=1 Tax=Caerostris darwini TaxID=1538125 RepID=A0AAV4W3A6_9ARAC|nr:hypothetical protein CDAR_519091 [Caerostris darwini]GIY77241.1 hypothetical protein CDAR_26731 [Caerostris darwini]